MKKGLIIGIILIIISLGLFIYQEFIDSPKNLYSITNSGMKIENKKAYIDATFVAGTITNDDNYAYYVMFGNGVQYIIHMNNKEASKISRYLLDNEEDSYYIEGVTKIIPEEMVEHGKKFVKEWLDNNHNHDGVEVEEGHTHEITTDDFYHYFGYVYLDCTNSFSIIKLIMFLTGISGILVVFYSLNTKYHLI